MEETIVPCPYCGEKITLLVDFSIDKQTYIEDCSVCCRPIQIEVVCEGDEVKEIQVGRS